MTKRSVILVVREWTSLDWTDPGLGPTSDWTSTAKKLCHSPVQTNSDLTDPGLDQTEPTSDRDRPTGGIIGVRLTCWI